MADITIAGILAGIIIAICLLLVSIDQKRKRKRMNQLFHHFSELGSKYNLNFSSQAILSHCIIALDGVHRKFLILHRFHNNILDHELIDLDEVRTCSVKELYGSIKVGALKKNSLEQYLEKIVLCFEFKTQKPQVEIPFYEHSQDSAYYVAVLGQKARDWESFLSKMLDSSTKKIA